MGLSPDWCFVNFSIAEGGSFSGGEVISLLHRQPTRIRYSSMRKDRPWAVRKSIDDLKSIQADAPSAF